VVTGGEDDQFCIRNELVDEWQAVPEVLGAVKRAVDEGAAAGTFVLTGSSQADLTAAGWPATGRLIRVLMYGLAERELEQRASRPPLLDRLASEGVGGLAMPPDPGRGRPSPRAARRPLGGAPTAAPGSAQHEALQGHPLHGRGLDYYAIHEVHTSRWISEAERVNSVHPYHQGGWHSTLRHF
jgi:hypothetical protein